MSRDQALLEYLDGLVPEHCQQGDCMRRVEIWCPLCERFLCIEHDELVPARHHDCLGGTADV